MSTELHADSLVATAGPELTSLGKQLEILRIERGVSKQHLARFAGTSRQQLWRVMTGKSELTSSLRERLAAALNVEARSLGAPASVAATAELGTAFGFPASLPAVAPSVSDYLAEPARLLATIRTLPSGDGGRRVKRALINALEDLAMEAGVSLRGDYAEIRRQVLAGEL